MKTVIVINGKPRAGKDTAVMFMRAHLKHLGILSAAFSSIDPIKELLAPAVDLSAKTDADRKLLSVVGDALQEHSEFRTKRAIYEISDFFRLVGNGVFFLHMREPLLIAKMKSECEGQGVTLLSILLKSDLARDVTNNSSDAGVETGVYDRVCTNNSDLQSFSQECLYLVKDILQL